MAASSIGGFLSIIVDIHRIEEKDKNKLKILVKLLKKGAMEVFYFCFIFGFKWYFIEGKNYFFESII